MSGLVSVVADHRARGRHAGPGDSAPADAHSAGIPLVLLHAFPLDGSMWAPVLAALTARVGPSPRVLVLTYPGLSAAHGQGSDVGLHSVADAAVSAVSALTGSTEAIWAGCSMGGYVALAIAERHAEAVAGLGLFNTRSTADTDAARATRLDAAARTEGLACMADPAGMAEGLVGVQGAARTRILETVAAIISRQQPASVAWAQRAMAARPDRTDALRALEVPAAVVWGKLDTITSFADAENMAAALGTKVTTNGVGHLSPIEDPSGIARVLASLSVDVHGQD